MIIEIKASELTHDLLEEQNVSAEISEQLEIETKQRLKLKEDFEEEKEKAIELEKVTIIKILQTIQTPPIVKGTSDHRTPPCLILTKTFEKLIKGKLSFFFQNFEKIDIEYAELRQRYNQSLETMNNTVTDQATGATGDEANENYDERKTITHPLSPNSHMDHFSSGQI